MKLILTAAVENLGAAGEIVEVKDGYGRNYLLPRNLAIVATRGAEKQIATMKRAQEERAIRDLDHAREVKEQLEALTDVSISVRTSEKGKIFGSVSADNIAAAIKAAGGPKLEGCRENCRLLFRERQAALRYCSNCELPGCSCLTTSYNGHICDPTTTAQNEPASAPARFIFAYMLRKV